MSTIFELSKDSSGVTKVSLCSKFSNLLNADFAQLVPLEVNRLDDPHMRAFLSRALFTGAAFPCTEYLTASGQSMYSNSAGLTELCG